MLFRLLVILIALIVITGCDQGQQMMKPVLTPEVEIPTVRDTDNTPTSFAVGFPDKAFTHLVFHTAADAYRDDGVKIGFNHLQEHLNCDPEIPDKTTDVRTLALAFTNREARLDFLNNLPGKYHATDVEPTDNEVSDRARDEDPQSYMFHVGGRIFVVGDATYYGIIVTPNAVWCHAEASLPKGVGTTD